MKPVAKPAQAGFTLTELLISMSLALAIMLAVLSSYIFLGRSLTRLGNQQTLEFESRRALAYFSQDVRMSSGISGTPSNSSLTLILSTGNVTYTYNSTAGTLTRTPPSGSALILASNITSGTFAFRYYDESGVPYDNDTSPYTTVTNYLMGVKQISLLFTTTLGSSNNGTLTPPHTTTSPRLIVRNRGLLP